MTEKRVFQQDGSLDPLNPMLYILSMKKDFLSIFDFSVDELESLMERAAELKSHFDQGYSPLLGKSVGLFFEQVVTKTFLSFEVGINQLWGRPVLISPYSGFHLNESTSEIARVFSRYLSCLVIGTLEHSKLKEFARYASIPVINAFSDLHSPCQVLADFLTIFEKKGRFSIKLAYIGEGNNIAHSLIEIASRFGTDIVFACPEGYEPYYEIIQEAKKEGMGKIELVDDPLAAVKNADVIYCTSPSVTTHKNIFQVNLSLLKEAKPDVIVMHSLPAHKGIEITDDVIDSPHSVIFDQVENRLHTQKALFEMLIE
jgi:ornithine carbamoyltransferase